MNVLRRLFHQCFFGHSSNLVKVVEGKTLWFQCSRCQARVHQPLKGQRLRVKKEKAKVLTLNARGGRHRSTISHDRLKA